MRRSLALKSLNIVNKNFFGGVLVAALIAASFTSCPARAQNGPIIQRGDAVVTSFSKTKPPGADLPADVHPIDRTFIDPDGVVAQVHNLQNLGNGPLGQLVTVPVRFKARAGEIGQVFGVALGTTGDAAGTPDIYLTATSAFGLQIVMKKPDGAFDRIINGEASAQFMPGQFGETRNGGPGSVWKVDGKTGAISLLANLQLGSKPNGGAALGNIAFDEASKQLFVSDLETGMIFRLGLDGQVKGTYDHGVAGRPKAGLEAVPFDETGRGDISSPKFSSEDPGTWGFADIRRGVYGLAVQDGRLYYSATDGPEIWSVSAGASGFGDDARREIEFKTQGNTNLITHLLFDGSDTLYVSSRGEITGSFDYTVFAKPQQSVVVRYKKVNGGWLKDPATGAPAAPEEYAIGIPPDHRATVGGVALNYGYDNKTGQIDYGQCRQTVWSTGEHLREGANKLQPPLSGPEVVHGLQGEYKDKVRPDNVPPVTTWFIDNDGKFDDAVVDGHIGDVAIYSPCLPGKQSSAPPPPGTDTPGQPNVVIEKSCDTAVMGGVSQCAITVTNTGNATPTTDVSFSDATVVDDDEQAPIEIVDAEVDGDDWKCSDLPTTDFTCSLPGSSLPPGTSRTVIVAVQTADLGGKAFQNCARLSDDNGGEQVCAGGGEPSITVEKTAPATCAPGQLCTFDVTVSNRSANDFAGKVTISDNVSGIGPTPITAIDPPLPCDEQPTTVPFTCTGDMQLDADQSQTFQITMQMPDPGEPVTVENCVAVSDPQLKPDDDGNLPVVALQNNGVTDGPISCAVVEVGVPPPETMIDPPLVDPPLPPEVPRDPGTPIPGDPPGQTTNGPPPTFIPRDPPTTFVPRDPPPPLELCRDGRRPLDDGRCPCPRNSVWNYYRQVCERPPIVVVDQPCPGATTRARDGTCRCPSGTTFDPRSGQCFTVKVQCGPGQDYYPATGTCQPHEGVRRCPDGSIAPFKGPCPCLRGQVRDDGGRCYDRPKTCPNGKPVPFTGVCPVEERCADGSTPLRGYCPPGNCGYGMMLRGNICISTGLTKCPGPNGTDGPMVPVGTACPAPGTYCPDGTKPGKTGCVPPKTKCADGTLVAVGTQCPTPVKCSDGTAPRDGKCPPPPVTTTTCRDGTKVPYGAPCPPPPVKCPDGSVAKDGKCPTPPPPAKCPDGSVAKDGKCPTPPPPVKCPDGSVAKDGKCPTPPPGPNSQVCPDGQYREEGKCPPPKGLTNCPDGTKVPAGTPCPSFTKDTKCPDGTPMPKSGRCVQTERMVSCRDGTKVPYGTACPTTDVAKKCPDGSPMPANGKCGVVVPSAAQTKACPDGSKVPVTATCPPSSATREVTCRDGSKVPFGKPCPTATTTTAKCPNGSPIPSTGKCAQATTTTATCPDGSAKPKTGVCPTKGGQPTQRSCAKGTYWDGAKCTPDQKSDKPPKDVPKTNGKTDTGKTTTQKTDTIKKVDPPKKPDIPRKVDPPKKDPPVKKDTPVKRDPPKKVEKVVPVEKHAPKVKEKVVTPKKGPVKKDPPKKDPPNNVVR